VKKLTNLYNEIIEDVRSSKVLSHILPSVLILAKQLKNDKLEKWTNLELNSYFRSNNALTSEVVVPEYRTVPGQYHDIYGRPLIITDPSHSFVSEYRLRYSVAELEKMSQSSKLISISDPNFNKVIGNYFKVSVNSFDFSPTSVIGVLSSIRTELINQLIAIKPDTDEIMNSDQSEHLMVHKSIEGLHPSIIPIANKLYSDGHYRQAILDTYILLIDTVKIKSGRRDLDGSPLMQTVFSVKNPVIKVSEDSDEQLGFMWMFSGAVMGIRNPKAHRLIPQTDPQRTLEWLSFASVLLRVLDDAQVIHSTSKSEAP
jgi:uncharacterized protein (TIGR02391 family)